MWKQLYDRLYALLHRPTKVFYICGSDILPPPLPGDEERLLLERAEAGDEAARQRLIERNLRLVVFISRRFENTGICLEDLISIGTIGLIKGISTFRVDRGHQAFDLLLALH